MVICGCTIPIGVRRCYCSYCKHCILTQEKGKWICGSDSKTYFTEFVDDTWEINRTCQNGKFEFDREKFKNIRW